MPWWTPRACDDHQTVVTSGPLPLCLLPGDQRVQDGVGDWSAILSGMAFSHRSEVKVHCAQPWLQISIVFGLSELLTAAARQG